MKMLRLHSLCLRVASTGHMGVWTQITSPESGLLYHQLPYESCGMIETLMFLTSHSVIIYELAMIVSRPPDARSFLTQFSQVLYL
ncbi:hypothetical protein BDZ94DRAFT_1264695 [Collybia nuda]|uniref:Uncharacterized protein n=1 Tax=Collybia nuda TaxID=64659 RepID=A0A9P5Y2B8_9AGAR|nr:hypothetical protein BDZ94DRAFT_1264695 [Collybia nuda]